MTRSAFAIDPRHFGRRVLVHAPVAVAAAPAAGSAAAPTVSSDLRLFATTFAAGFLFVSVLLA